MGNIDGGLGWLADPGLHMLPQAYWFRKCEMSGTKPIVRKAWPRTPLEKTAREDCDAAVGGILAVKLLSDCGEEIAANAYGEVNRGKWLYFYRTSGSTISSPLRLRNTCARRAPPPRNSRVQTPEPRPK